MFPPRIYPITDSRLTGLSHRLQVEALATAGAKLVQLREKHAAPRDFFEDAGAAIRIARTLGTKIVINDRVDLALALGADGVHLGQDDLPPETARRILGSGAIIGFSTHSVDQAISAIEKPIDYLAIGPVFPTRTKEDPDDVVGLAGIRAVRAAIGDFPLVAIGGIDDGNITDVLDAGADSAALISALLVPPDAIIENYSRLMSRF